MSWIGPRSVDGGLDQIVLDGEATAIWLCGKRVVGPDPEAAVARVEAEPVTVVCLCQEHEIAERYPEYLAWLDTNAEGAALWRPVPDLAAPTPDAARAMAAEINERLDAGHQVIVHCGAGLGRAPTIAIAALLARGHDLATVEAAVVASRPLAGAESGPQRELLDHLAARDPAGD